MTTQQAEALLGLKGEYSPQDVKNRYRKLSKISHPDSNGDEALFSLIKEAYELLKDSNGFAKAEIPTKEKEKTKSHEKKESLTERAKIISSLERIDFNQREMCLLASGYTVDRDYICNGKKKTIKYNLQDFVMNYYQNMFFVFDMQIAYEEIGFFSSETGSLEIRHLSIPSSSNMIGSYEPIIKVARNRKVKIKYTTFNHTVKSETVERDESSKMTILEYSIDNITEFGTISIKLIVRAKIKRE